MIDWVTAEIRCNNSLDAGCVAKINEKGEVDWVSPSALSVRGSHDINILVKPLTENIIRISGNPAKWLQGHNLFGSNDLRKLMSVFFSALYEILCDEGLNPTIEQIEAIEAGNYTVSRVDINESWELDSQTQVKAWIRAAGEKMSMPHRGKGVFSGDTLYWGKGSKYWFLKCYSKGDEINSKKSNFPSELRTPQMIDYANRSLRLELVLCSKFLREIMLNQVCHWKPDTAKMLLLKYISNLEMSNNFMLEDELVAVLPKKLAVYYKLWLHGEDLRLHMSRPTFYRIRKQLKEYGVDIALIRDKDQQDDKVIPVLKVLEAKPMGIPDWAYEKDLVAC